MGLIQDIGEAFKDMRITTEANSNSDIKRAEAERDASNYQERQCTVRNAIWAVFFMVVFLVGVAVYLFQNRPYHP